MNKQDTSQKRRLYENGRIVVQAATLYECICNVATVALLWRHTHVQQYLAFGILALYFAEEGIQMDFSGKSEAYP